MPRCLLFVGILVSISPIHLSIGASRNQASSCPATAHRNYTIWDGDIFVAPWGWDGNTGSRRAPLKSLREAARRARPGDIVLMRGGVFRQKQMIGSGGAPNRPITFAAYPGERPVFDGKGVWVSSREGLIQVYASDIVFDGITIRHSKGRGLSVYDADRVTLRRSFVHDTQYKGVAASGDDFTVEDSRFRNLVLSARDNRIHRRWDGGVSTWHRPDGRLVRRFVFRNNDIARVWGECVVPLFTDQSSIVGNRIRDCYSVGIYADNARRLNIERNVITRSSNEFNRVDNGRAMIGVGIAVERYGRRAVLSEEINVTNNLIVNTDRGVSFYDDQRQFAPENTYRRIVISHNVICNIDTAAVNFPRARGWSSYGNVLANNVLCKARRWYGQTLDIRQAERWTIGHNGFANGARSIGFAAVVGWPGFVGGTGSDLDDYRLRFNSALKHTGMQLAHVDKDAFCRPRHARNPSIGLHD